MDCVISENAAEMKTHYITVDIELRSTQPFRTLCQYFTEKELLCELYPPDHDLAHWAANVSLDDLSNADACIQHYCYWLLAMPEAVRTEWESLNHKCMNIGYNTSSTHYAFSDVLSAKTVTLLAMLDLGIAFTLYPVECE